MNDQTYRYEEETPEYESYEESDWQSSEDAEALQQKKPKYAGTQLLLILQIVLCAAVLLFALAIKLLGGNFYTMIRDWYVTEINRSVIASDQLEEYQSAWKGFFSPNDAQSNPTESGTESTASQLGVAMNVAQTACTPQPTMLSVPVTKPLEEGAITSGFGDRSDPFTSEKKQHRGLDIGAQEGSNVTAILPGVVTEARENSSYGKYLLIDHGNGIQTRYAHCNELLVAEGATVSRGATIAKVGMTGEATGYHLHLEFIVDGVCCDPQPLLGGQYV